MLGYYDRTYRYGLSQRPKHKVVFVDSPSASASENAEKVRLLADEMTV
ncbi:MAG: hypothetical protein U5K32_03780 [Bacteroidales bacterium]|nr:hypothetical protein [Bacteroidales bacterium]